MALLILAFCVAFSLLGALTGGRDWWAVFALNLALFVLAYLNDYWEQR